MINSILGAGGAIGTVVANELIRKGKKVRLISRQGIARVGAESVKADVTKYSETLKAIEGSGVVYLCIGLNYNLKEWADYWPLVMQNTINACRVTGARLIFFDNVYMYGKVDGKMTEENPYNPCSKKGEVRARIATSLQNEMAKGNILALIARSADFYGPESTKTSVAYILCIEKMLNGKKPMWMVNADLKHSYTFTTDCGKALPMLAEQESAFGQIWHLPTHNPGITGKEFIHIVAKELNTTENYMLLKKWMIRTLGIFDKTLFEINEMLYQFDREYYFDSTKFNQQFNFVPTTYEEGILQSLKQFKNLKSKN